MITARQVKKRNELAVLKAAIHAHNQRVCRSYEIIERPDPPDAIIEDEMGTTWIEHTNAFFSREWAQDLQTFPGPEEKRVAMPSGPYGGMDHQLALAVRAAIVAKAGNPKYQPVIEKDGPGILVVGLESPWLDTHSFEEIYRLFETRPVDGIGTVFSSIYLGSRIDGVNVATWFRC